VLIARADKAGGVPFGVGGRGEAALGAWLWAPGLRHEDRRFCRQGRRRGKPGRGRQRGNPWPLARFRRVGQGWFIKKSLPEAPQGGRYVCHPRSGGCRPIGGPAVSGRFL